MKHFFSPVFNSFSFTRSINIVKTAFLLGIVAIICAPVSIYSQDSKEDNSLGVVKPNYTTERSVIAVAAFGADKSVGLEYDTIPRVIRRDLAISGFFLPPADQQTVNRQNLYEVSNNTVQFEVWQKMGVKYYLMGSATQPNANEIKVRVMLYDIDSKQLIINRHITGPASNPRLLAHRISDEIVETIQFVDGIAQTKLMFLSELVPGIREVSLVDADGFNQRPVTQFQTLCTTPAWGANGTEVYYTSYKGNRAKIYGHMLSSGKTWEIASYGGTNHSPAWNQNRRQLLMTLSKDGNSEIYAAQRDGKNLTRLTRTKATEGSPTWSPDGSKFAYVSNESGGAKIFIVNADGSGKRQLTTKGTWNDAPSWSPDGEKIVFVSRVNGKNDIFTINSNGDSNTIRRLTENQGNNESPSWAPNSRHIAFSSNRLGGWQVFVMLDDGSNQIQLTTTGRNTQPDWGPFAGE